MDSTLCGTFALLREKFKILVVVVSIISRGSLVCDCAVMPLFILPSILASKASALFSPLTNSGFSVRQSAVSSPRNALARSLHQILLPHFD